MVKFSIGIVRNSMAIYRKLDFIGVICANRISWIGRVQQMAESRVSEYCVLFIQGKRKVSRPRLRRVYEVEIDVKDLEECSHFDSKLWSNPKLG